MPQLPQYGRRSLAEVVPALLAALDAGPATDLVVEPARAAALLLVDGLGVGPAAPRTRPTRRSSRRLTDAGPLTVGFPSSTVDQPRVARHRAAAG